MAQGIIGYNSLGGAIWGEITPKTASAQPSVGGTIGAVATPAPMPQTPAAPAPQAPAMESYGGGSPSSSYGSSGSYSGIAAATDPNHNIQPTFAENTPNVTVNATGNAPAGNVTQGGYEAERQQQANIEAQKLELSSADAAKRGQMELAARLQGEAETRRIAAFSAMSSGGGNVPGGVERPNLTGVNEQGARDAAFARAKEQAGSTALASLNAFKDIMAGTGKTGSSLESGGMADIVGGGAHDLNEFTRDQLMLDLNRAADIGDQQYQGNITQRGQDISAQNQRVASIAALMNMPGLGAY